MKHYLFWNSDSENRSLFGRHLLITCWNVFILLPSNPNGFTPQINKPIILTTLALWKVSEVYGYVGFGLYNLGYIWYYLFARDSLLAIITMQWFVPYFLKKKKPKWSQTLESEKEDYAEYTYLDTKTSDLLKTISIYFWRFLLWKYLLLSIQTKKIS